MKDIKELKIALIGVSHWHVPLYFRGIKQYGLHVTAVSDQNTEIAERYAAEWGCRAYADERQLVRDEKPDFVFAFGKHSELKNLAFFLIDSKIPFAMEKPMGMCRRDVEEIKEKLEKNKIFCAVPLVWRYSDLMKEMKKEILPEDIIHLSFRFIAGPPKRYLDTSPWMLEKKTAGSGSMTNLGVHFIDMAMNLTGAESAQVLASSFHRIHGYDIEDYAVSLLKLSSGASLELETGYAFPMDEEKRENLWTIVTKKGYYRLGNGRFEARKYGCDTKVIPVNTDSDIYYPIFVKECLTEFVNEKRPTVGVEQMLSVAEILEDIISKAN
jgi:predicted dehydrogenase